MAELTCPRCDRKFKTQRGLDGHVASKHPPELHGPVAVATEIAIDAADHLTPADAGAVAVLRELARKIDGLDERGDDAPLDNVTIPTYLKYATDLALTPLGRLKLGKPKEEKGGKLAQLRSIQGGRAS